MKRVAIVGSGMVGANLALELAAHGHAITLLEKGPDYPYPMQPQFEARVLYGDAARQFDIGADLQHVTMTGDYRHDLGAENVMVVGGATTRWAGLTMRMSPADFRTRTRYGFSDDWPLGYDDLERWYGVAERRIGVSGTDEDNPWAPPRSTPYPLPPFPLGWDDQKLAGRLKRAGILMHSTPQARLNGPYDGRPGCMNYGACAYCPIGARYSGGHHVQRALETGRVTLRSGVSVRRVLLDAAGRTSALVCRANDAREDFEVPADLVIVAGGALESTRLLLLSREARHPDGLGNASGHLGRNLVLHHIWSGHMHYAEPLWPGREGPWTGQSMQFADPPTRGRHGGIKIELPSAQDPSHQHDAGHADTVEEAMAAFATSVRCRRVAMHAESSISEGKFASLSETQDRFGDARVRVHYNFSDFDRATYEYSRELYERVAHASGAQSWSYHANEDFDTFMHHMGTCRMSARPADGVVDPFGQVHGIDNLYVFGLSTFVGAGGASNPTLTALALALRSADRLAERLKSA